MKLVILLLVGVLFLVLYGTRWRRWWLRHECVSWVVFGMPESKLDDEYWLNKRSAAKREFLHSLRDILKGRKWRFVDEKRDDFIWTKLLVSPQKKKKESD